MMEEFKQDLVLDFKVDKNNLEATKALLDKLEKDFSLDLSEDTMTSLNEVLADFDEKLKKKQDEEAKQTSVLGQAKEWAEGYTESKKKEYSVGSLLTKATDKIEGAINKAAQVVSTTIKDAWASLGEMYESSLLTNDVTFDLAMQYGTDAAQTWALSKTEDYMGFNLEDIWRANESQQKQFLDKFEEYENRYKKLYDTGFFTKMQEFEWAKQDFLEQIEEEIASFFVDNKDRIMEFVDMGMSFMEKILDFSEAIVRLYNPRSISSESDVIERTTQMTKNMYNVQNKTSSNTLNLTNNYNNVSNVDKSAVDNANKDFYRQIIASLP